jgi:nucleotide-binding universal stress UspA family protein
MAMTSGTAKHFSSLAIHVRQVAAATDRDFASPVAKTQGHDCVAVQFEGRCPKGGPMVRSDNMRLQHLTLATDLTARSDRAFDRAVYLARQWNARLLVVHAVEEGTPSVTDEPTWRRGADRVRAARRKLQFEYPGLEQADSAIDAALGSPYDLISQAAEREQTDLIITGVAGENPYGADDLGTLVPALAKSAPAPLLVVKKRLVTAPRRVVVASDLTDTSHTALRLALDLFGPVEKSWSAPCGQRSWRSAKPFSSKRRGPSLMSICG